MALPQVCLLTAGSLAQAQFMLSGLIVDQAAMKRNLDSTRGLIVAEAVMMGLAPRSAVSWRMTRSTPPAAMPSPQ